MIVNISRDIFKRQSVLLEIIENTVNGVFEVMKSFGYTYTDDFCNTFYKPEAYTFGEKIFQVLHNTITEFTKDKDYKGNIEQVPKKVGTQWYNT